MTPAWCTLFTKDCVCTLVQFIWEYTRTIVNHWGEVTLVQFIEDEYPYQSAALQIDSYCISLTNNSQKHTIVNCWVWCTLMVCIGDKTLTPAKIKIGTHWCSLLNIITLTRSYWCKFFRSAHSGAYPDEQSHQGAQTICICANSLCWCTQVQFI